jgi:hypothetical protein
VSKKTLDSDYAILDVKKGRAALARRLEKGEKVKVTIVGTIDYQSGNDDGTSIEFSVSVASVEVMD